MKNNTPGIPSTSRRSKTEADIPSEKEHFTPGPWYIKPREVIRYQRYGDAYTRTTILDTPEGKYKRRHVIATVARGNGREEANAALMAAAPELLESLDEALELIQDLFFGGCATVSDEECEKASAMLKKGYAALDKARMKNSTPSTPSIPSEKQ